MAFCMKKFLSYFCLIHSTNPELAGLDIAALGIPENFENVIIVIDKLEELHNLEIESVVDKILRSEEFTSPEFYANAILRIFVKLSTNPTQWNFMLICTIINSIILEHYYVLECFTFAYIGLQCLLEVYERCYKDLFNGIDEYETLAFHCGRLNPKLIYEEYDSENPWPLYDKGTISSLIESLQDIDDVNFEFTDSEQALLNSLAVRIQTEVCFEIETNNSSESSTDEDSSEETTDRSNVLLDFSSHKNKVCVICEVRCVGVVVWCRHELARRENRII